MVTPFIFGTHGLGKGNPFWICLEDVFYKGLNKKKLSFGSSNGFGSAEEFRSSSF